MKYLNQVLFVIIIFSVISCNTDTNESEKQKNITDEQDKISYISLSDVNAKAIQKRGATITKVAATELSSALKKAIKNEGAEKAILFCNLNAIKITDSLATAENVTIRRIAIKNRNPENEVNAKESEIFTEYLMEWQDGKTLESKIAIDNNGHPVYYKPIIINKKCLTCHGEPGKTMPSNIASKIEELYPDDKAINFEDGHPRGMWAITFINITLEKN